MPVSAVTEDIVAQTDRNKLAYPDPFFDLARNYIPRNIKTLFKFCKTFFYTNGFLRNVVTKLTEYPITDILYDDTIDEKAKEQYDNALHRKLKIKSFLIEIGLDYFTFGNAFISTYMKPKRFLKCSACGKENPIENVSFKLEKFRFKGTCPDCQASNIFFEIKDEYPKSINNFKLVRWSPENIDIEYNPMTGSATYYYLIPNKIKKQILVGNKTVLAEVPEIFLESLRKKRRIILDEDNLYHFKRPTLAEDDMGWGKPIILPALKEIYYLQTLRRGNEAIANEHVVPKKSVFPANTTTLDPFTQMNLGKWKGQIEEQLKKWKYDPNHIGVFPIPIGYQELGGNARALLLTPEMKFVEESIINSLGVPIEFIKGGTTWTGSSISLRIVENHFLTYRELLLDFLNHFLIPNITAKLKYSKVRLKFKKFKMSDDIQAKNLVVQLNQEGKISDAKLLDEFGFDAEEEAEALKRSRSDREQELIAQQVSAAEAQGQASLKLARYQARANAVASREQLMIEAELFQDELARENVGIPEDPAKVIEKYAIEIMGLAPGVQTAVLNKMSKQSPVTYSMVMKRLQQMQLEQVQQQAFIEQALAPVMDEDENKATTKTDNSKEKTKGQTTGTP